MPKISIIVPVCNVEKYLSKCLDSIVNQTLKEIEIICIDDGSTDDSGAILDSYSQKDSRIKVIHKKNSGYGNSMNVGMDCAEGEYIGIVESDDCILPEMYEELYKAAKES
ncbi:MAG: glycosyltransferase family 2 protein, partial [Eubacterium sp.]|nr:glycosyltransferase family 2 protein [Eubacterium sp.]